MKLTLVCREKVIIAEEGDLAIIFGNTKFRVDRAKVSNISPFFSRLLNGNFSEANQPTITMRSSELTETALEFILRAAHGATEDDLLAIPEVQSDVFLESLGRACHFFHCGYLVPSAFKQFLKLPHWSMRRNRLTDFMPSMLAAYWIGWSREVEKLFRFVVRGMSVTGAVRDHWVYRKNIFIEDIEDFPPELLAALKSGRERVIKRFLRLIGKRQDELFRQFRKGASCPRHPGQQCVSQKYGFFQYLNQCIDVIPKATEAKDIEMAICTLLWAMKDERTGPAPCALEMRWHYSTLHSFWEETVAPRGLLSEVKSHLGKPTGS